MASRRYQLKYNVLKDAEIISRLDAQSNIQDYIRKLVLSDIAADHLLGLQSDIENGINQQRIEYWEKHCPAATNPDYDCSSCHHAVMHWTTGDQVRGCDLEDLWNEYKQNLEVKADAEV